MSNVNNNKSFVRVKKISVDKLQTEMILGAPVISIGGGTILPEDTILEATHIETIKNAGIDYVYIIKESVDSDLDTQKEEEKKKVIIIDIDTCDRKNLKNILINLGLYVVAESETVENAYNLVKLAKPDIITMEINDGITLALQTIKNFKEINNKIKIVVVTNYASVENIKACIAAGIAGFIKKPFAPEKIVETMGKILKSLNNT